MHYKNILTPSQVVGCEKDISEFNKKEAAQYYNWFMSQIPERIKELEGYFEMDLKEKIDLDYSPNSLVSLWECFMDHTEIHKYTKEEQHLGINNNTTFVPLHTRDHVCGVREEVYSLLVDMGIYLGEVIIKNYPQIFWEQMLEKNDIDENEMVLKGFQDLHFGNMNPIGVANITFSCEVDKRYFNYDDGRSKNGIYGFYLMAESHVIYKVPQYSIFVEALEIITSKNSNDKCNEGNLEQRQSALIKKVPERMKLLEALYYDKYGYPMKWFYDEENNQEDLYYDLWEYFSDMYKKDIIDIDHIYQGNEEHASIVADIGFYFCAVFIENHTGLYWGKDELLIEPVVKGFPDESFFINPFRIVPEAMKRTIKRNNYNILNKLYKEYEKELKRK